MQELFGPELDPQAAIVTAGRRALRQHPTHTPVEAIRIWLRAGDTSKSFAGRKERLLQGA
jgi:hypothetical protein